MSGADERRLRDAIAPIVADAGFDLEAVTVSAAGRRRVVKIIVDSDEGVDLDRAADVSRSVATLLDADDAVLGPAPYVLEVTSPGVGRPLTEPRHFRRSRRRLLVVTTTDGRSVTGHLLRVVEPSGADASAETADTSPTGITLLVGAKADEVALSWDQVARAKVEVEFSPAPAAVRDRLDAELGPVAGAEPIDLTAADDDIDGDEMDAGEADQDDAEDDDVLEDDDSADTDRAAEPTADQHDRHEGAPR